MTDEELEKCKSCINCDIDATCIAKQEVFKTPVYETLIAKASFINQDIIVFPGDVSLPDNITNVIKFLFGAGAYLEQDTVNNYPCLIIKGASYVLCGAKAINADWVYKEVEL